MDQILLCSNHIPMVTSINNSFIKKHMLHANGSYVKVYLYLSMCIQYRESNLSISSLADQMENTEKDILRAITYWEKQNLLYVTRDASGTITGIDMINPDLQTEDTGFSSNAMPVSYPDNDMEEMESALQAADIENTVSQEDESSASFTTDIHVTAEQIDRLAQNEDFSWVCLIVESYLERPIKPNEVQLLTYLFDELHFSKELLLHLYEYCISLGKTNVKYVQAVALSWAENGVTTTAQAEEFCVSYNSTFHTIAKTLGLGRSLASIERRYADRWLNEWHMDLAVVIEACNRTLLSIQKADFKYIDGILTNWHNANVHTLQDVATADEAYNRQKKAQAQNKANAKPKAPANTAKVGNQFQSFQQRDTSKKEMDELEKILLNR